MVVRYNQTAYENENKVRKIFEEDWGAVLEKTPPFFPIDFYVYKNGKIIGSIEVKRRSHRFGTYPTVFLAVRKYEALKEFLELGTVLYAIHYDDRVCYVDISKVDPTRTTMGGRTDRTNASHDIEELIEIPIEHLVRIS